MSGSLVDQTIDGRYRIECHLGSGGMGTVWRAQHVTSLQRVAVKTLRVTDPLASGAISRCLNEARAAAALRSRHIVRVTDAQANYIHEGEPLPYLVMELLAGMDFESILHSSGSLNRSEFLWVIEQVGRGIQVAHEHGIVHRDLKPSNLFLVNEEDGAPIVKICDFGLAKNLLSEPASDGLTTSGVILGTPRYMSPEQFRGGRYATAKSDQWAIGLIAFRFLSGRDYFGGATNALELSLRVVHDELVAPSRLSRRVPPEFDDWFFKSCQRDPERRFPDVSAQVNALVAALQPAPAAAGTASLSIGTLRPIEGGNAVVSLTRRSLGSRERLTLARFSAIGATSIILALGIRFWVAKGEKAPSGSSRHAEKIAGAAATMESGILPSPQLEVSERPSAEVGGASGTPAASSTDAKALPATAGHLPDGSGRPKPTRKAAILREPLDKGALCHRSSECRSGLCIAERCR